jgi:hypothetical protein
MRIFPGNQQSAKAIAADETTLLRRDEEFIQHYQIWKQSGEAVAILHQLKANILTGIRAEDSDFSIDLHYAPGANGFSISDSKKTATDTYRYLADYFKEKVLSINYRLYSSMAEKKYRVDKIIRLERHYLKPAVWLEEMPMEQLFGNIMIELEMSGESLDYLKILATYYTGFDYKPAKNFDDLVLLLLEEQMV